MSDQALQHSEQEQEERIIFVQVFLDDPDNNEYRDAATIIASVDLLESSGQPVKANWKLLAQKSKIQLLCNTFQDAVCECEFVEIMKKYATKVAKESGSPYERNFWIAFKKAYMTRRNLKSR